MNVSTRKAILDAIKSLEYSIVKSYVSQKEQKHIDVFLDPNKGLQLDLGPAAHYLSSLQLEESVTVGLKWHENSLRKFLTNTKKVERLSGHISQVLSIEIKRPIPLLTWKYDSPADVMYISFNKPQPCLTIEPEPGICLRYKGNKLNGITIVDYSKRTC